MVTRGRVLAVIGVNSLVLGVSIAIYTFLFPIADNNPAFTESA